MNNTYKTVNQLSTDELEELRFRYADEHDTNQDNVSDEDLRLFYNHTSFTEEDFFCNLK